MTPRTTHYNALAKLIFITVFITSAFLMTGCDPQPPLEVKAKILADITDKVFDIYNADTGVQIDFDLIAGQDYYMAVNTTGLESINNRIVLYFKHFRREEINYRMVEFRLDPTQDNQTQISVVGNTNTLKLWKFNLTDRAIHQEVGTFQVLLSYRKSGISNEMYAFDHYNLKDASSDVAVVVNPAAPIKNVTYNVGYLGLEKTEAGITAMLSDLASRYAYATKNYGQMTINNLGRQDYPADNTTVAGKLHDYTAWWNSVSHDLSGTDLLPLDPTDPMDMPMIKMAWYDHIPNRPQLKKDAEELFGLSGIGGKTIMYLEAPYWAAGGSTIALTPINNMFGFMQTNSSGEQWGRHKDFGPLEMEHVQKIALHESGHLYGMTHPVKIQEPSPADWTVQVGTQSVEVYGSIMHQGSLKYYPTDLFYVDEDIKKALQPNLDLNTTPKLEIPFLNPVGDPIKGSALSISGRKQANSSITENGIELVAANPNTYWAASVPLIFGENRYDIAQVNNGQTSHPFILYVTRSSETLPSTPTLTLTKTYPATNTVNPGGIVTFDIEAKGHSGLKAVWWWVEKKNGTEWEQVEEVGHWHDLYGSAKVRRQYKTSMKDAGEYKIRARARDMAYPMPGQKHQSNIGEIHLVVQ
jgi:hypothetical protein